MTKILHYYKERILIIVLAQEEELANLQSPVLINCKNPPITHLV